MIIDEYRVLVCGGRDYRNRSKLWKTLDWLHAERRITLLIEGGARGADALAFSWAEGRDVPRKTFRADWTRYGNQAGPVRNAQMLREGQPHLVVAAPGGTGTTNMRRITTEANVPLLIIEEDVIEP